MDTTPAPASFGSKRLLWVIIGIAVAVLVIVLIARGNGDDSAAARERINEELAACERDLLAWQSANPQTATPTPTAQEELAALLERCESVVEDAS